MRIRLTGARVVPGALALLVGTSLSACGSQREASYEEFCTGYVQVIQAEIAKPLDVGKLKQQVKALRDIGSPSDLDGKAADGLDAFLSGIEKMPAGATTIPPAPGDEAATAFGAYTDAHCRTELEKMIPSNLRSAPAQLGG